MTLHVLRALSSWTVKYLLVYTLLVFFFFFTNSCTLSTVLDNEKYCHVYSCCRILVLIFFKHVFNKKVTHNRQQRGGLGQPKIEEGGGLFNLILKRLVFFVNSFDLLSTLGNFLLINILDATFFQNEYFFYMLDNFCKLIYLIYNSQNG